MQTEDIARIVGEVLSRLEKQEGFQDVLAEPPARNSPVSADADGVVHSSVDSAVKTAARAQKAFHKMGIESRRKIIKAMRKVSLAHAERMARFAVEETGLGRAEDKVQKNRVCALRTPGIEDLRSNAYTGDQGLTLVEYAPFGVVAAITPSTNPVATIINNSISILSAGNAVVFSPHPSAAKCCAEMMRILCEAIEGSGGPRGLIATVVPASQETTKALLAHPGVAVNLVTGGPAIVKVAMTVGKTCKTIAAGPGNPPAVVDETAIFPKCAADIDLRGEFRQ